jgi:glycosyltransferase involved in cell wall biosynthesis
MALEPNSSIKLSVIIACFNGGSTLAEQLEALVNQKWRDEWEVIIVDNGSTDNTRQIVESFGDKLMHLRVVEAVDKKGAAYARNVAILEAKSDRFAFCDADDQVGEGWVASMGETLGEHDVVVSQIDDQKLNQQWLRELWQTTLDMLTPILGFLPAAAGYGLGFTRRVYEQIGAFDESLPRLSDIDYTWRAQIAGFKLKLLPNAVVHYRYRDSLNGIFEQAFLDGQAQVMLYKRYREHGMLWDSWWQSIRSWVSMIRQLPELRTRVGRGEWVVRAGNSLGHLWGSIKYGVVAL